MNSKNHATPVVEKRDDKACSCGCTDCTCGPNCPCGCKVGKTAWLCGTIFVSALLISGSILMQNCLLAKKHMPPRISSQRHMPMPQALSEKDLADFIMKNPELLIESVDRHYQKAAAKEAPQKPKEFNLNDLKKADAALVQKIINDKTNYSLGNPNGKFVIIEFFDYQCGWCKKTNKGLEDAIKKAKNIRWIPIDTPIFGQASEQIARYVLAAGEQGKYTEMHTAVGEATGTIDEAALIAMGKKLNLNTKKLTEDANGAKIKAKLESNNEFRKALNINGVPMVIVDGHINPGALIGDNLDAVVKLSAKKR